MKPASPAERIHLCRAYDARAGVETTGARLLIDRLWPRGIAKADLPIDAWLKDLAPSTALRKWFGHDPAKWAEFSRRYIDELRANPTAVDAALDWCRKGPVTLIYGAKDTQHANVTVLHDHLAARLAQEAPND
ncbi:MAG: DUF488 family protein [Paracoccaceae bacterium]